MEDTDRERPRIALAFPVGLAHLHHCLQGIKDYARKNTRWTLVTNPEMADTSLQALVNWEGDGAIAVINSRRELDVAGSLEFPFVSLSSMVYDKQFPKVHVDHVEVGRYAGIHLRECGFSTFAYFGMRDCLFSKERLLGFKESVSPAKPAVLLAQRISPASFADMSLTSKLHNWISSLPLPIGLFATNDTRARAVADACAELGLSVPDDVAIVGVDDNEVICEFGEPTLTSIPCNRREIGYRAAKSLDRLLQSSSRDCRDIVVQPEAIVRRDSTNVGIFSNRHAMEVHQYVRGNISRRFGAVEVAKHIGISRRRLEQCVREATGQTPYEYICHLRLEHAKGLLRKKKMTIEEIARNSGFRDGRHFRRIFSKAIRLTPSEYRDREAT